MFAKSYYIYCENPPKMKTILSLFLLIPFFVQSQEGFVWNSNKSKIEIPFQYVFNLIIVPVEINNVPLNLLLDSGSGQSVIFSLPENDTIQFKNTKKILTRGLGLDDPIEGLVSQENIAKMNGYENQDFKLLIILNQDINFSSRLGIEVHGILGYSFFKNHIVEIDYEKNKIILYKDRKILDKKRIAKFQKIPLKLKENRPYIDVKTQIGNDKHDLDLLVDIGLSDGLWLFENDSIKCHDAFFDATLGIGFSGEIKGKKSRVDAIQFAGFTLNKALVSYPYPIYLSKISIHKGRNGSVGNEVLKRFSVIFDNQGRQLLLKKNSNFRKEFNYNMSGITVEHHGSEYVTEILRLSTKTSNESTYSTDANFKFKVLLKPFYEVATVSENSPGALSGLLPSDKIIRINRRKAYEYTLQDINELLQSEEGKWIYFDVERKGKRMAFKFQLKKII